MENTSIRQLAGLQERGMYGNNSLGYTTIEVMMIATKFILLLYLRQEQDSFAARPDKDVLDIFVSTPEERESSHFELESGIPHSRHQNCRLFVRVG